MTILTAQTVPMIAHADLGTVSDRFDTEMPGTERHIRRRGPDFAPSHCAFPTGLCNPGRFGSSWTLYPDRTMM
jgi:hypothetical protein